MIRLLSSGCCCCWPNMEPVAPLEPAPTGLGVLLRLAPLIVSAGCVSAAPALKFAVVAGEAKRAAAISSPDVADTLDKRRPTGLLKMASSRFELAAFLMDSNWLRNFWSIIKVIGCRSVSLTCCWRLAAIRNSSVAAAGATSGAKLGAAERRRLGKRPGRNKPSSCCWPSSEGDGDLDCETSLGVGGC